MSKKTNEPKGERCSDCPKWLEYCGLVGIVLFLASPFLRLTDAIRYRMFMREHDVGLLEIPSWDLHWEFYSTGLGCTFLVLANAPIILALLLLGGLYLWTEVTDRT